MMAGRAKKAAVIGWPISHSRSPLIHNYWLKKYGISGSYESMAVKPNDLAHFFDRIRSGEFVGCNVTIPHKEMAYTLVEVDDAATKHLKSVNTIYLKDGRLVGKSTDGQGFFNHLHMRHPDWVPRTSRIAVYGAGGAARAIIAEALSQEVATIIVTNRTLERADAIAADFGTRIQVCDVSAFAEQFAGCDLLVNTTALGMTGQPPLELSLSGLPQSAIVADIVYVPLQTRLLRQAQDAGHRVLGGLGMLLHQAAPGFEKWFGVKPQITEELREIVAADINAG